MESENALLDNPQIGPSAKGDEAEGELRTQDGAQADTENDKSENIDETLGYTEELGLGLKYITYSNLAQWTSRASQGVMEVLLDQSDAQAVPASLINKSGEKEVTTTADKKSKQDRHVGVLNPSWSRTKTLQLMIHSPPLIANLKAIDRKLNWHAHMMKKRGQSERVVFIRPFKFLILREDEIRERFKELERYRANVPVAPPPPPMDLPLQPYNIPLNDAPLETTAMDNGNLQPDTGVSDMAEEDLSNEEWNPQRNDESTENTKKNSKGQEHISVGSEELAQEKTSPGSDANWEISNEPTVHTKEREWSSTEQATDASERAELRVSSTGHAQNDAQETMDPGVPMPTRILLDDEQAEATKKAREEKATYDVALAEATKKAEEEKAAYEKALVEAKAAAEELEKAKKAAEEEADRLKPSDGPEAPIKFRDAVGRKFSFPWHLCKTWKGMEELIKQAFVHVETLGPHVFEGHYDLVGPYGEIMLPQVWETLIQPDWAVTMHMWPMPDAPPRSTPEEDDLMLRNSPDALEDFRLLIRFLDEDLKDIFDMRKQIEKGTLKKIAFDDLWHLFHYGEEVILHNKDRSTIEKPRAARVLKFTGGRNTKAEQKNPSMPRTATGALGPGSWGHSFVVQCWTLTFDGSFFWPEEVVVGIRPYEGERVISSLPIYPSKFDRAGLLADLIEHGKIYRHFTQQAFSHRKYLGKNYESDRREEIDSEVIIDFREASSVMSDHTYGSEVKNLVGDQIAHDMREIWVEYPEHGFCGQKGWCIREVIGPDFALDDLELDAFLRDNNHIMQAKETIDDSEVAILPDRVPGYVLNRKIWALLSTSNMNLMELQATSDPWNDLVLEPKLKVIIEALVAKHLHHPTDTSELDAPFQLGDFVAGKGRSIVLLLHGPPGVGKTSTAECIAAHMERPLYPLTSGNLPVRADDLEEHLQVHFNLAARWGCILLLDEADVFLQRRRLNELEINAMVSVFLRQLEYYRGILFLTTNRVGDIDPAFKSRIHVSLEYEPLDRRRTKKIYKLHLRRIKEALELRKLAHGTAFKVKGDDILVWSDQHFKKASKRHRQWNGRQIHNAFQTAVALAEWEARTKIPKSHEPGPHNLPQLVLGKKQFKQVAQVSEGFDQYMTDLMGGRNEAEIAAVSAQRYDFRPGKARESQSKKSDSLDSSSDSDYSSGSNSDDKERKSSEDESGDSNAKPKKRGKRKSKKDESGSDSGQSSADGKRKRNKGKGRSNRKTQSDSDASEGVAKSKQGKDKGKAKSKHRGSMSGSD